MDQTLHDWGQGILVATMVDGTLKTNWKWHYLLEALHNRQLFHGKIVVKNNFDISKKTFKELFIKSNLNVLFFLNVVIYSHMLHNIILNGKDIDIDELMFQPKA